jgi:hypothetical protein
VLDLQVAATLLQGYLAILTKLHMHLPFNRAIPLLGIYPEAIPPKILKNTHTSLLQGLIENIGKM